MDDNLFQKLEEAWYLPYCTPEEVKRILEPKSAADFLLSERANIVADNMRYTRVYMNKARIFPDWSFEKSFRTKHYTRVLHFLSEEDKQICQDITFGDMFSNDVNGYAYNNNQWGKFISLNEALRFFMRFCNLSLLEFSYDVPDTIRLNSLRIAIRVLLKQEAMDFFMDPRGAVPESVGMKMLSPIENELQFIAGHEFSHHLLGHLSDNNLTVRPFLVVDNKSYEQPIYNVSQLQEFEADIEALVRPKYKKQRYTDIVFAALLWFCSLELGEAAQNYLQPQSSYILKTHPDANERFENILRNVNWPTRLEKTHIFKLKERTKKMKELLIDDIATQIEYYEFYGSVYLDKPNTEWRGKELVDRVDYY